MAAYKSDPSGTRPAVSQIIQSSSIATASALNWYSVTTWELPCTPTG